MKKILFILLVIFCGQIKAQTPNYRSTYEIIKFNVDSTQLHWTTVKESGSLAYEIQQYLWGTWTTVNSIMGNGTADTNKYVSPINLCTGENLFRIVQHCEFCGIGRFSKSVSYITNLPEIKYTLQQDTITFNRPALYEIRKGDKILKSGYGNTVSLNDLKRGEYILNYDVKTERINKH